MKTTMRYLMSLALAGAALEISAKPLDLLMGARGYALGGAFAGVADDATAAYWNPAGLSHVSSITLSETNWLFQDVGNLNVNYLTGSIPVAHVGTVAGGWLLQHALLQEGDADTRREQDWNEHAFSISGGRRLWDKLGFFHNTAVGVGFNRYVISSGDLNGAGMDIDVGFLTDLPGGVRLGLVGKHLGADMMGEAVEPEYRLGLSYRWTRGRHGVLVAADLAEKSDVEYVEGDEGVETNWKGFGGLEYAFTHSGWSLAARGGANNSFRNSRDGIVYTAGAGVGYSGISLQYAFQGDSRDEISLGTTHRITFELSLEGLKQLGKPKPEPPPAAAAPAAEPAPVVAPAPAPEPAPAK